MRKPLAILVIDDAQQASALEAAFVSGELSIDLEQRDSGELALTQLEGGQLQPDLIVLDVQLPRGDGLDFLRKLRSHATLKTIPVFVVTQSRDPADVAQANEHNVVGYMLRPQGEAEYCDMAQTLLAYWSIIQHPRAA